jgi:phosphate transport system permease protein
MRRRVEEAIAKSCMILSICIVMVTLLAIVIVVVAKGFPALNWSMITQTPKGGYYLGKEGGIANAIVGSLYLAFGATIVSLILSLPVAFVLQKEYMLGYWGHRFAHITRLSLDVLFGVPSIVYGAFGFVIMLYLGLRASLLAGIIVLTFLMLPIMIRTIDEVVSMIPDDIKQASYVLGATKHETTYRVVFRQVFPGIITAVMLAFTRGIGDAASILFTSGYTDYIPTSLFEPVASLPLAIFFQLATPVPEVQQRAYASALVLLVIILIVSFISRVWGHKSAKYSLK